ncbi:MAG: biotin synthase BioB [Lentisphaerae bacterium]|mgnify:CR=1 FL=1|nr:biotin synthase BioB [Lentisphaerota bacterium]
MLKTIVDQAVRGTGCTKTEAQTLIELPEGALFSGATRIREAHFGHRVQLCSIINAKSGKCDMDCRFCSQSGHNSTAIEVYPFIEPAALKQQIEEIVADGRRLCGVVTSGGKLSGAELRELESVVQGMGKHAPAPVCASLGRLEAKELARLKAAGIRRFHHNLESSENYYPSVCSTQSWRQRCETVKAAQAAGLSVCSGGLFGLGEGWQDRIDLALELRELGVDSVPINFLYAHPGTPMAGNEPLSAEEALRIIALYRYLLPTTTLRVCGGRSHILGSRQKELFAAGANGLMTGNYLTVAGSQYEADLEMIAECGLVVQAPG